jgi:cytochrome P450
MLARWRTLPDGVQIDAADELMRLTYDIISATMFSNDVTMDYRVMAQALATYIENVGRVDIAGAFGAPDWLPTPRRLRAWPALRFFRREMGGLIARRRALIAQNPAAAPQDLLTLLLTARDPEGGSLLSESEVFDNVMTFIFAGHETTANALAWTIYLLSEFPDWDQRVAAEAQSVLGDALPDGESTSRLAIARMVIEEAMRLYPPAPLIARDAVRSDKVGDVGIEAGTFVLIPIWVIHRHRLLWADAELFDPERFAPGRRERIDRFSYLPFGGGPRICIGMGFAMNEALIILSMIAREFRLELARGFPVEPMARITLRPRHGLRMSLRKRQNVRLS